MMLYMIDIFCEMLFEFCIIRTKIDNKHDIVSLAYKVRKIEKCQNKLLMYIFGKSCNPILISSFVVSCS